MRRFSFLPWLLIAILLFVFGACDLPSARAPIATRVVTVETPIELTQAAETMRAQGCILTHLIEDPAGPGTWAVFSCVDLGQDVPKVPGLP